MKFLRTLGIGLFALFLSSQALAVTVTSPARDFESGTAEYFSKASNSTLQIGANSFAAWAWVKIESVDGSGSGNAIIWKDANTGTDKEYQFGFYRTGGNDRGYAGVKFSDGTSLFATHGTNLSTGVWYFFFMYWDHATQTISINVSTTSGSLGTPVTNTTSGKTVNAGNSDFYIGYNPGVTTGIDAAMQGIGFSKGGIPSETTLYNSGSGKLYSQLTAVEKTNLVSFWNGNENAGILKDAYGSNDLTDNNTVTTTTGVVTYNSATARQYTRANNESHSLASASSTGLSPGDEFFYGYAWVNTDSHQSGSGNNAILTKDSNTLGRSWILLYSSTANAYRFFVSADGTNVTIADATNFGVAVDGTWHLIEFYHDPTNNLIGVAVDNGAWQTTSHTTGIYSASTAPIRIGQYWDGGTDWPFDGKIGPTGVWKGGSAIPDATFRKSIWNGGVAKYYHDLSTAEKVNLSAYWDGAESFGTRFDASGNNNHLSDNNTVTFANGNGYYTANTASDFEQSTGEFFTISDASGPNLGFGGTNTVMYTSGWIKPESFPNQAILWGKIDSNLNLGYQWDIRILNPTTQIMFLKASGIADYSTPTSTSAVPSGAWSFVEGYNSGTQACVSVNREPDVCVSDTANFRASTGNFWIGCRAGIGGGDNPDSGSYYDGLMANVVVITGAVPTTAERNAFYNRGFGCDFSDRPTLSSGTYGSWFPLTESSGNRADSATNGYTAVDHNTVTGGVGVVYDTPAEASSSIAYKRSVITM